MARFLFSYVMCFKVGSCFLPTYWLFLHFTIFYIDNEFLGFVFVVCIFWILAVISSVI